MNVQVLTTSYADNQRKTKKEVISFHEDKGTEMQVVNVYPNMEYQEFTGFGGAVTEASGYAFSKLSEENQQKILDAYFGENGNRYTLFRTHIDSCDFSLGNYSAVEDPEDVEMKTFSLARDEQYILPLLRKGYDMAGEEASVLLSPWSPPAFMKTNGEKNNGGRLKEEYREFWAEYICRYIREYQTMGFRVDRITIQNEPKAVQTWDSCVYSSEDEKIFLRDYLYPAMVRAGLSDVKVNIWDHNKERMLERAQEIIDKDTDHMVSGIAFHWYSGDHFETVKMTAEQYPGKEIIFTEGCVEYSRFTASQLDNAKMYAHDMIGNMNAGMTAFYDWNLLLDEKGGPNHVGNYCDAPIMCDTVNDKIEEKLSFTYIGHFSRYIKKGAVRIGFSRYTDKLEMTAFKNTDNTLVLVMLNRTDSDIPAVIRLNGQEASVVVPADSIATAVIEL